MAVFKKLVDKALTTGVGKMVLDNLPSKTSKSYLDLYRASVALKGYEFVQKHKLEDITPEIVNQFHAEVDEFSESKLSKYVSRSLDKQVKDMFIAIDKNRQEPPKRRLEALESTYVQPSEQTHGMPFQLLLRRSGIPNAGEGVFIRAQGDYTICPGTLVALYPGLVHLKEHVADEAHFDSLLPDPGHMLMSRLDQHVIDGRTAAQCPPNPYGLAHKINHCGRSRRPNVLPVTFDYIQDPLGISSFPQDLRYLIPNVYAKPASWIGSLEVATSVMKGLLFIAAAPLSDGDELLADYRFDPTSPYIPDWYEHYSGTRTRSSQ